MFILCTNHDTFNKYLYITIQYIILQSYSYQPKDIKNGFGLLEAAVIKRCDCLKAELHLIMSVKDMLEGEVGSVNLQKDLIQKDLITITEQHDALKAAYHALSYENAHHLQAPQVVEKSLDDTLKVSLNELQLKFEQSEESNRELKSKLTTTEKKLIELEKWPGVVNTIEERMNILLNERANLESIANNAKEEVKHYKKLTETLKDKMKKMSNNSSDTKQFLDSFEEGMRRNEFIFVICLKDEYDIIIF